MSNNSDRLSQIWKRVQSRASVDLSSTSVEHTQRPSRHYQDNTPAVGLSQPLRAAHMPEGMTDPVSAALSAMHTQMAEQQKSGGRRSKAKGDAHAQFRANYTSTPPETNLERTLFADMAFTESKVNRRDTDYITYAAGRQADWQRRKRKKFLGIF